MSEHCQVNFTPSPLVGEGRGEGCSRPRRDSSFTVKPIGGHYTSLAPRRAHATRSAQMSRRERWHPGSGRFPPQLDPPRRRPTPRQRARWDAVQVAKRHGFSLQAIARQLGLARATVRKHAAASGRPVNPRRRSSPSTNGRDELTESLVACPDILPGQEQASRGKNGSFSGADVATMLSGNVSHQPDLSITKTVLFC